MAIFRLPEEHYFPPPCLAEPNGLLAIGGDLLPSRLLLAYSSGIFPWYSEGQPILWFSPDPRYVLLPKDLHIGRSLKKRIRKKDYELKLDTAFDEVVEQCSSKSRTGQFGTWITQDMKKAYSRLFSMGFAHSAEFWVDGQLLGGLYGVVIGNLFAGESMFAHQSDASKIAFVWLVRQMAQWDIELIDCQVYTDHLSRFGAKEIPREEYIERLPGLVRKERKPGSWAFELGFDPI